MKTLYESLLDDFDAIAKKDTKSIKAQIKEFLKQTYKSSSNAKISKTPNEDGLYVVDWNNNLVVIDRNIEQLTNGLFTFGEVKGGFGCYHCEKLKTLEGAPQIVHGNFSCSYCRALESFKGGPQIVDGEFDFSVCDSITSLEGAPKQCERIMCQSSRNGYNLKSLEGCPQAQEITLESVKGLKNLKGLPQDNVRELKIARWPDLESLEGCPSVVKGLFLCAECSSLKNFVGAPKEVGRIMSYDCTMLDGDHPEVLKGFPKKANQVDVFAKEPAKLFTVDQILAVCDVDPSRVFCNWHRY